MAGAYMGSAIEFVMVEHRLEGVWEDGMFILPYGVAFTGWA